MYPLALLELTIPAADPVAARQWYADELGLQNADDVDGALAIGDVAVSFGPQLRLRVVAARLENEAAVTRTDPAGTPIDAVPPDLERARRGEDAIREMISGADDLDGPPVDDLVAAVKAVVDEAHGRVAALLADIPHNKVLATQLALGQRAREITGSAEQWPLHAASTLLSGLVISGASG